MGGPETDAAPGRFFRRPLKTVRFAREGLGAAAFAATLQAGDVAAVFLVGIHRALFAGAGRLGDRADLLFGLGGFLDLFLAGLAFGALLGVRLMLGFLLRALGGGEGFEAGGFSGGCRFFARALLGLFLFLALGPDEFETRKALSLMVDQDIGLDRGLGFEFFKEGFFRGERGCLPVLNVEFLGCIRPSDVELNHCGGRMDGGHICSAARLVHTLRHYGRFSRP
jgi:hypothetical protein